MRNIKKRLGVWAIVVAALLMIPVFGNWPWTAGDFIFGAVMLFGAALVYEFVTKNEGNPRRRAIAAIAVFVILAVLWVAAATGFGD